MQYDAEGLTFDVQVGGPEGGTPVVLLHGFPEDSSSWDTVVTRLHAAGCRTYRPDQRGYSPGARPKAVAAYRMSHLVGDVLALLDAAGLDKVHLVGHDWGGGVAWAFAGAHPERLESLTVCSTPHPSALTWAYVHTTQGLASWYMLAFAVPFLPELLIGGRLDRSFVLGDLPREAAARYARRFPTRESFRGPLNWYRAEGLAPGLGRMIAARFGGPPMTAIPASTVRTTYVWGADDIALKRPAAERTARYVTGPYRFVELDAGHWLPELNAEQVADAVLETIGATG
jgi:pimeloyl-ACP methyl ester carboxylesterase